MTAPFRRHSFPPTEPRLDAGGRAALGGWCRSPSPGRDDASEAVTHELLDGFPVVVRLPVQWGDMDAYGHVNNTAFFRYFESARVEYLERCGFTDSYEASRVGAILHSTTCRFRRALTHPDTVLVGATAREVGEDRFTHAYRLVSLSHDAVAAEGEGVVVSFDYRDREKAPIPDPVRQGIAALEEGGLQEDGDGGGGATGGR